MIDILRKCIQGQVLNIYGSVRVSAKNMRKLGFDGSYAGSLNSWYM